MHLMLPLNVVGLVLVSIFGRTLGSLEGILAFKFDCGGEKSIVTFYLKISPCRNGRLKGGILPHPLAYEPCLDLAAVVKSE